MGVGGRGRAARTREAALSPRLAGRTRSAARVRCRAESSAPLFSPTPSPPPGARRSPLWPWGPASPASAVRSANPARSSLFRRGINKNIRISTRETGRRRRAAPNPSLRFNPNLRGAPPAQPGTGQPPSPPPPLAQPCDLSRQQTTLLFTPRREKNKPKSGGCPPHLSIPPQLAPPAPQLT